MIVLGRRTKMLLTGLFVLLPILELIVMVLIGQQIGALAVVLYVVALGLLGSWLIRRRWRSAWESLQQARTGELPLQQAGGLRDGLDTALFVAGCLALIFPGVITDVIGLILLLPFTRTLPRRLLVGGLDRSIPGFSDLLSADGATRARRHRDQGDIIEGEVVDEPNRGTAEPSDDPLIIRGEIDPGRRP